MKARSRIPLKVAVVATGMLVAWLALCLLVIATGARAHDAGLSSLRAVSPAGPAGAADGGAAYWLRVHDALPTAAQPLGWSYPFACCSGLDCREVEDSAIVEEARGYRIRATGEFIAQSDPKIKPSPDGHFHWCSKNGADDSATICLFVPPRGF